MFPMHPSAYLKLLGYENADTDRWDKISHAGGSTDSHSRRCNRYTGTVTDADSGATWLYTTVGMV